jgi:Flp pilus assembly protein TadG
MIKPQITHKKRQVSKRRGATIVEFALIVPILLALLMGILEWAWLARTQLTVANAAREGIRHAVLGNTSTSVQTRIINAAAVLRPALSSSNIVLTQTPDRTAANPTYYAWPADTTGTTPRNGVPAGNIIRVQVNYTHRSLTGFFPIMNNRNVSISVHMAREATG